MLVLYPEAFKQSNRTLCRLKCTFGFTRPDHRGCDIGEGNSLLIFSSVSPVYIEGLEKKCLGLCKFSLLLIQKSLVIVKTCIEHVICLKCHGIYLLHLMIYPPGLCKPSRSSVHGGHIKESCRIGNGLLRKNITGHHHRSSCDLKGLIPFSRFPVMPYQFIEDLKEKIVIPLLHGRTRRGDKDLFCFSSPSLRVQRIYYLAYLIDSHKHSFQKSHAPQGAALIYLPSDPVP